MSKIRECAYEGSHHIILKGIDRNNIFNNNDDKDYFIYLLTRYSNKLNIKINCYSLMNNHVHILATVDGNYPIGEYVKRICISYTEHYFNKKYDREGSLFQGKFFSRVINDDNDYITVVKYILNNPKKGGIARNLEYKYSSFKETVKAYNLNKDITFIDTSIIRSIIKNREEFIRYTNKNEEIVLCDEAYRYKDSEILNVIVSSTESGKISEIREIKEEKLRKIFNELIKVNISVNRIARICSMGRYRVRMILS